MTTPLTSKQQIREAMLQKRLALNQTFITEQSQKIQDKVLKHPLWIKAEKIGIYSSAKNEVETQLLFMKGLEAAKSVYFPRVEQGLQYYEVEANDELQRGAWGILEPKDECKPLKSIDGLDLIIVPALAFDNQGYRIGYGKAFYDRLLAEYPGETMGLAFDFQIVESVFPEAWDKPVKRIITEIKEYVIE